MAFLRDDSIDFSGNLFDFQTVKRDKESDSLTSSYEMYQSGTKKESLFVLLFPATQGLEMRTLYQISKFNFDEISLKLFNFLTKTSLKRNRLLKILIQLMTQMSMSYAPLYAHLKN